MVLASGTLFTGNYKHALDSKDRLTIPSIWRSSSIDQKSDWDYILLPMPGSFIAVFTEFMIQKIMTNASDISMGDEPGQDAMRNLFYHAVQVKSTTQGRITLNKSLLQHAGIDKEVMLVGTGVRFEIWNPEALESKLGGGGNAKEINDSLMRLKI